MDSSQRGSWASREIVGAAFFLNPNAMNITRLSDGQIVAVNEAFLELFGFEEGDVVGKTIVDLRLWNAETRETFRRSMAEHGLVRDIESSFVRDGRKHSVVFSARKLVEDGAEFLVGTFTDITGRQRAEEELGRTVLRARCLLWAALVTDVEGTPTLLHWEFRPFSLDDIGRVAPLEAADEDAFKRAWDEARVAENSPSMKEVARRAIRSGQDLYSHEFSFRDRIGNVRWMYETILVEALEEHRWRLAAACTDITERRRAQEQEQVLRERAEKQQRLVAVGQLAAGIAHDFNNVLAAMTGFAELAQMDAETPDAVRQQLDVIVSQGERAGPTHSTDPGLQPAVGHQPSADRCGDLPSGNRLPAGENDWAVRRAHGRHSGGKLPPLG